MIIGDLRRLPGMRTGRERYRRKHDGCNGDQSHQPSSFDQLRAWTYTPSGFFRRRSTSRGVWIVMVRMAVQRSVAASAPSRSEEHTSELQSLMRISYAVFCLKKKRNT